MNYFNSDIYNDNLYDDYQEHLSKEHLLYEDLEKRCICCGAIQEELYEDEFCDRACQDAYIDHISND